MLKVFGEKICVPVWALAFCFLLLTQNVLAQPVVNLTTEFESVDTDRTNTYMDAGGVWNGTTDVTNTTGDLFRLILANTAVGPAPADTAFDVVATIDVPAGFRLPQTPYAVIVTERTGNPACPVIANTSATQPGGAGTTIDLNLLADTDIEAGCTYAFQFGLTAETTVVGDTYQLTHNYSYNVTDNTPASEVSDSGIQAVEVRVGDVITLKTAVDNPADPLGAYAPGETAEWNIRVRSSGLGGAFDVVLTDTLGADFGATTPTITYVSGPTGALVGNQFTIPYMDPSTETVLRVQAVVPVFAAAQCPDLRNTGSVADRVGNTDSTFDSATYELDNPLLSYTAPNINVAFGAGPQNLSIPLQNVGDGLAVNVTLNVSGLVGIIIDVNEVTSPGWTFNGSTGPVTATGTDSFSFTGTLAASQISNINFTAEVDGAICPAANTGALDWTPDYQNICGTSFQPPLAFTNSSITNQPDLQVQKTVSAGAINIGQTGFYNITFTGNNITALPTDGNTTNNNEFTITDTLPANLTNAVINSIPAGTVVLVNALTYTAGNPIPDNATITWTGDQEDLTPLPTLQIDYTVNPLTCPAGQTVTNTAVLDYPGCTINNNSSVGFIANDNPAGGATTNFTVIGGGTYEAGAPDTDGIAGNEINEGEHIQFQAEYVFPPGFAGTWSNSTYNATLGAGTLAAGSPDLMRLIQNPVAGSSAVFVEVFDSGLNTVFASTAVLDSNLTGGDGTAAFTIDNFDYIGVALGNDNLSPGYTLRITYTVTVPEGNTTGGLPDDDVNIGGSLENATLTVSGGPLSCLGNTEFVQGVNVNIVRADVTINATLNTGQPVGVCEIVPLTLDITDPGGNPDNGTEADNLSIRFDQTSFEFVDAGGNDGDPATDITYAGSLLPLTVDGTELANNVFMTVNPATQNVNAAGSATFNVRLRDRLAPAGSVTGELIAEVNFDSNHTSIDNPADSVPNYDNVLNNTPTILEGQLDMEFQPPAIFLIDQSTYSWTVTVTNVGTGTSYNAEFTNTLPAGMTPNVASSSLDAGGAVPVISGGGQTMTWQLGDLAAGASFNITVAADIDQTTCFQGGGENISSEALWGCGLPPISISEGAEPSPRIELPTFQLQLQHDATDSFCELCGDGEIRLLVNNSGSVELSNIVITEDLLASGLTYQATSTDVVVDGVTFTNVPLLEPTISGVSNQLLTWDMADIITAVNAATPGTFTSTSGLVSGFTTGAGNPQSIELIFRVDSPGEPFVSANRNIQASATFDLFCGPHLTGPATSGLFELPIREPIPVVEKQIRNIDAGQPAGTFVDNVSIARDDDIIWRINIQNTGDDDLEALLFNDVLDDLGSIFNMNFTAVCNSEANAENVLTTGLPAAGCIAPTSATTHNNDTTATAFIGDISSGGQLNVYIAGTVIECTNNRNDVDIEWGCNSNANPALDPIGGLTSPAGGGATISDSADSNGLVNADLVTVSTHTVTGTNGFAEPGSKGEVTIVVENAVTNGVIANFVLTDVLPFGYDIDTNNISVDVVGRFGPYPGIINGLNAVTPLTALGPDADGRLGYQFNFAQTAGSTLTNPLRGGDTMTITFTIIQNTNFDTAFDTNTREEINPIGTGFDPANIPSTVGGGNNQNTISLTFGDTCGLDPSIGVYPPVPVNEDVVPAVEDVDIDIDATSANRPIYILGPSPVEITIPIDVQNRQRPGGVDAHPARDITVDIALGEGLAVGPTGSPANCSDVGVGPRVGLDWQCTVTEPLQSGAINTQRIDFPVQRSASATANLSFVATVTGEVTDGTQPTPVATGNDYSLDSIRAVIIGFDLDKQISSCTEHAVGVAPIRASNVQIGEDCTYQIEAQWTGINDTPPGFIEIKNINIFDDLNDGAAPNNFTQTITGQGFISDVRVNDVVGTALTAPAVLAEGPVSWLLPTITNDATFTSNVTYRTLNDPQPVAPNTPPSGLPNQHDEVKEDVLVSTFTVGVDFNGNLNTTDPGEEFLINLATPGYPAITERAAALTIAEPNLVVIKEVCNESRTGPCDDNDVDDDDFVTSVLGDSNDEFIYRIRLTNPASGTATRASAFNVVVTDQLDAAAVDADLITPALLETDGFGAAPNDLDNDGDGVIEAVAGQEGTIVNQPFGDGLAATITFSHTHSTALERIDEGDTVDLLYRVMPENGVFPGQTFTNTVNVVYDSLLGDVGSQNVPNNPPNTGDLGGARLYQPAAVTADLVIQTITTNPGNKNIPRASRDSDPTPLPSGQLEADTCLNTIVSAQGDTVCIERGVVVGEEIEFELRADIPQSTLQNLVITDTLPAGLECVELGEVILPGPASVPVGADFTPGGNFNLTNGGTCAGNTVIWNFGNQVLSTGPIFDLRATFIARVVNTADTSASPLTISNGGATLNNVNVSFLDEFNNPVSIIFDQQVDLQVLEPQVSVTKNMGVLTGAVPPALVAPLTNADATDILWVEVVIDNAAGAAPLYGGLRVYDDLLAVDGLIFNALQVGSLVDVDVATRGPNQPIFTFDNVPGFYPINAGETRRFAFSINVDASVEPQEILNNTIQAAWLSLPDNTVALNAGGTIGANGADDGLRAGRLDFDPVLTVQNDYNDTGLNNTISVPAPQIVKTDISAGGLVNTIGARRQYQVQITLPEGITQSLTLQDNLNTGSGNLVIENEAAFPIVYSCAGIATINTVAVNCADSASIAAALTAAPVDEAGGIITWNVGNIVTQTEDDNSVNAIAPSITIQYLARVADTVDSIAGNTVQNTASSTFIDGEAGGVVTTASSATAAVPILEPDLIVNVTGPAVINAGNNGVFNVTVLNPDAASTPASTTTSTAWDATIDVQLSNLDPAAGGLCNTDPLSLVAPTLQITDSLSVVRALTAGVDYTTTFLPAPACTLRFVLTPNSIAGTVDGRFDAGDTLSIQYTAQVDGDSPDAATLTTIAGATEWFSQDTDGVSPALETRRYTRVLTNGTSSVNDHEDEHDIATASADLAITKTLLSGTVGPGETLTYRLSINNSGPVGVDDFRILDDLGVLNAPASYFVPGSLVIVNIDDADPALTDDDVDNSNALGGTNNQGLVDISNLDIDATGGAFDTIRIDYSVDLQEVLPNGARIRNQATAQGATIRTTLSNILDLGPIVTSTNITFKKTVQDLTGDPNILVVGDRIRYTLTAENTGDENATAVTLFDAVPANTTYVANSLTLNNQPIGAPDSGVLPLETGIEINSPDTTIAGRLSADAAGVLIFDNLAVITFDVIVGDVIENGAVISNQGRLLGQGEGGLAFEPIFSDNPATLSIPNDPTEIVLGSAPLVDALKTVAIQIDNGTPNVVDQNDVLRYTITVVNNGNVDATGVRFIDLIPFGTSYFPNSTTLNAVSEADVAGTSPLITGIDIESLGSATGVIVPGGSATITFDVTVNIASGTISNQGTVISNEQPDELTDFDGNDENGDQPTEIRVGAVEDLSVTKEVIVLGGGVARVGGQLQYVIRVENIGTLPANDIVITDTIPVLTRCASVATDCNAQLNGASAGIDFATNILTADYGTEYGALVPGESLLFTFDVTITNSASSGDTVSNRADVSWNTGINNASGTADVDIGGAPGVGNISGQVWFDGRHDNIFDASTETPLEGWVVRLYFNNDTPLESDPVLDIAVTDAQGLYSFSGLPPVDPMALTNLYSIVFSAPPDSGSNIVFGETISPVSPVHITDLMRTTNIAVGAGENAFGESLPVSPTGIIYNSVTREPVQNARVTLRRPRIGSERDDPLIDASCFTIPPLLETQQNQVTGVDGYYRFDLNFGDSDCPVSESSYLIRVETLNDEGDYEVNNSTVIPVSPSRLNVAACPDSTDDSVPSPLSNTCEVQVQGNAPDSSIFVGDGTRYFLNLSLAQGNEILFNNHIPVDESIGEAVLISKETPLNRAVRGQLVPYVITVSNIRNFTLSSIEVRDYFPPGFKYVRGSSQIVYDDGRILDGSGVDPALQNFSIENGVIVTNENGSRGDGTLTWNNLVLAPGRSVELKFLLVVGSGVGMGEYTNRAEAFVSTLDEAISGVASATIKLVPDPVFDCSDIIGKVFDDKNADGYQNAGEVGIGGVRVVSAKGLITTTDKHGRYHITCAAVPNEQRGSNFILKVDERSLPSGYRMTTENPRVIKLTRGKAVKFNFGASIHRVVRIDLNDAAFLANKVELKDYWKPTLNKLYEQLQKGPSVLRLSYLGDIESEKLAIARLNAIRDIVESKWNEMACCYNLNIETELYWRRGQPVKTK